MKVAVMQPYFCPYIGYFQLINAVDTFVVYDDIQYSKKGWFNRNRILLNGHDEMFTIPLKKDSDFLDVRERQVADDSLAARKKILARIDNAYRLAPRHAQVMPLLQRVFLYKGENLFDFIHFSLRELCSELGIQTPLVVSSTLGVSRALKGEERVFETVKALGADTYINAIGGRELYRPEVFAEKGIELHFIRSQAIEYPQFDHPFVPWLSIIDVMMFNEPAAIRTYLNAYDLE